MEIRITEKAEEMLKKQLAKKAGENTYIKIFVKGFG